MKTRPLNLREWIVVILLTSAGCLLLATLKTHDENTLSRIELNIK